MEIKRLTVTELPVVGTDGMERAPANILQYITGFQSTCKD